MVLKTYLIPIGMIIQLTDCGIKSSTTELWLSVEVLVSKCLACSSSILTEKGIYGLSAITKSPDYGFKFYDMKLISCRYLNILLFCLGVLKIMI